MHILDDNVCWCCLHRASGVLECIVLIWWVSWSIISQIVCLSEWLMGLYVKHWVNFFILRKYSDISYAFIKTWNGYKWVNNTILINWVLIIISKFVFVKQHKISQVWWQCVDIMGLIRIHQGSVLCPLLYLIYMYLMIIITCSWSEIRCLCLLSLSYWTMPIIIFDHVHCPRETGKDG